MEASAENALRVYHALAAFGAPLAGVTSADFSTEGLFYQMGRPPVRVDILTSIDGVDFQNAWPRRRIADFDGLGANFISLADPIRNKKSTGRLQDLADVQRLE